MKATPVKPAPKMTQSQASKPPVSRLNVPRTRKHPPRTTLRAAALIAPLTAPGYGRPARAGPGPVRPAPGTTPGGPRIGAKARRKTRHRAAITSPALEASAGDRIAEDGKD